MNDPLRLTPADRVLVIAPHPDDESIACGGLLLAADDAGAARRVVTLTDGDNNPWPQRWLEKRWRIDAAARARWGARRRTESNAALAQLSVAVGERVFLGLPDSGLTSLLMRDSRKLIDPLRRQIADFRPTLVACPALADRHPDHSAAHIATCVALGGTEPSPRLLAYRVHGEGAPPSSQRLELSPAQRDVKRRAIASHRTQMALSGKRFLAFATPTEHYEASTPASRTNHPLKALFQPGRGLELHVRRRKLHGNHQILILFADTRADIHAWECAVDPLRERIDVRDARDGRPIASTQWRIEDGAWTFTIPFPGLLARNFGFAKLTRRRIGLVVFDRFGWQSIAYR